jgi:hypothetical protein
MFVDFHCIARSRDVVPGYFPASLRDCITPALGLFPLTRIYRSVRVTMLSRDDRLLAELWPVAQNQSLVMEKKHLLALVLFVAGLQSLTVRGQGSLTPPGGPSPTMKTLAQVEPRTPISTLPFTISAPGSYYVTTNLTAASAGIGVTISSGNVVLDLSGFTLNGAKVGTSGIYVIGNFTNIVIRNGIVTSWTYSGVDAYASGYSRQVRMED